MKSSRRLELTAKARDDLRDIRRFTARRWDDRQRDAYLARLRRAMNSLLEFPEIGTLRETVAHGCRTHPVASHTIYYRVVENGVLVGRILHANQDPTGRVRF